MNLDLIIIIALLVWNVITFQTMSFDKGRAMSQTGKSRVPEKNLFVMALFFGSPGVYCGMYAFRHKTRKWYFLIGIPLLMFLQAVSVYYLFLVL